MSKAFTLIELIVVIAIIAIVTAVVLPSYRGGNNQLALQRSASKLAQDLRRTQEMSMSAKEISGIVPSGFGIYFNSVSPNNYIIFADLDNSHHRNAGDQDLETVFLESNIRISDLSPAGSFSILFAPPDPVVWINSLSSGITAIITLGIAGDTLSNQIISANNAGLIAIQ